MSIFSIRNIRAGWYKFEELTLSLLLLGMILLACLQIFLRVIFSTGLVWADPLLRYLVLWSGLLGAVVATRNNKHIAIDLISHLVSKPVLQWLQAVIQLFSLLVCLLLTYASVAFVINEASFTSGQIILGLSSWQLNLIFPLSFALISLHFLVILLSRIKNNLTRSTP